MADTVIKAKKKLFELKDIIIYGSQVFAIIYITEIIQLQKFKWVIVVALAISLYLCRIKEPIMAQEQEVPKAEEKKHLEQRFDHEIDAFDWLEEEKDDKRKPNI